MRRSPVVAALALAVLALAAGRAWAITGNGVPDSVHPYVGLVVFQDSKGAFAGRCSGALLSDRTFLTAGHCTATPGAASAVVYLSQEGGAAFDPVTGAEDPFTGYPYRCKASPAYPCGTSHTLLGLAGTDVGLVILDAGVAVSRYASVAPVGTVDRLPTRTPLTISGYGLSDVKPALVSTRERLTAPAFLIGSDPSLLQVSGNRGNGGGGVCNGDSGGPVLAGTSDVVLGVDSFTRNTNCGGQSFAERVDRQQVADWIRRNTVS